VRKINKVDFSLLINSLIVFKKQNIKRKEITKNKISMPNLLTNIIDKKYRFSLVREVDQQLFPI
ncbi:hypothetical protein ACFOQM_04965, partial [Paenibacillus sp. GCM10012307]|uniref:hypothetical protein n=1 Tax=Paenibacillus TaxID=44249 RepID=UPI001E2B1DA1